MSFSVPKEAEHLPERLKEELLLTLGEDFQIVKEDYFDDYDEVYTVVAWNGTELTKVRATNYGGIWVTEFDRTIDYDDLLELFKKHPELLGEIDEYINEDEEDIVDDN